MKLSNRLQAIHDLIPLQAVLVDVGTDHGLLMIAALQSGRVLQGYALDIAKKPLEAAKRNVTTYGLDGRVHFELRDGLKGFMGDGSCYVIAGMGADTILGIVESYPFASQDTIIVQSNTKLAWLRAQLNAFGFVIVEEVFLIDKTIPTTILSLKKTGEKQSFDDVDLWVGPCLKQHHNREYDAHLKDRLAYLETIKHHDELLEEEYQALKIYLDTL